MVIIMKTGPIVGDPQCIKPEVNILEIRSINCNSDDDMGMHIVAFLLFTLSQNCGGKIGTSRFREFLF